MCVCPIYIVSEICEGTLVLVISCFSMHVPRMQSCPSPQLVPSAHGKCLVWQTSCPRVFPVHHNRWHGACMNGHGFELAPKASSHCRSKPYDAPGSTSGRTNGFWGWSSRQSPAKMSNNNRKFTYIQFVNCIYNTSETFVCTHFICISNYFIKNTISFLTVRN